ncbi:MAG TPA: type II CAAX endopeptidase family protein [Usitatibacter sp.]|nr:type II CAAX endopeptidase family protein [Usitatibacter sp.]
MTPSLEMPGRPKDVLVRGAVRAWHVVFILLVAYVVAEVAATKLTQGLDPTVRGQLYPLLNGSINALIALVFVLIVPEFRRSLPILFAMPSSKPRATDLMWAFLAMLCWGYGIYLTAFLAPLMQVKPEWFTAMGFHDTMAPLGARHFAIAFGSVLLAPIAEELMNRGFLMNLWIARWGVWGGVIASSIVFGLFHRQHALFAAVMGFAFALVYLKYDSLWPGIAMHAAYNLLVFDPLLGQVVWVKNHASIQDLSNWIPEMIVAVLFFPVAYIFWRRFRPTR